MNRRSFLQALAAIPLVGAVATPLAKAMGETTPLFMRVTGPAYPGVTVNLVYTGDDGAERRIPMQQQDASAWRVNLPEGARFIRVEFKQAIAVGDRVTMSIGTV